MGYAKMSTMISRLSAGGLRGSILIGKFICYPPRSLKCSSLVKEVTGSGFTDGREVYPGAVPSGTCYFKRNGEGYHGLEPVGGCSLNQISFP